jgi:predicted nucleic acid-binding protein
MSRVFALDTSCMIAAICAWHEQHAAAAREIERHLEQGERMAISAHAIVETYAVLTRLPAPHRLSAADAWALVESNFVERRSIVALGSGAYIALLRLLAKQGLGGGRTYDGIIAACARESNATTLLTFNRRHFEPPPDGVEVIEPL